jgi:hypothetical protein
MIAFLSFLTTPLGRIVGSIGLIIMIFMGAWGWLKIRDAGIRNEALASFNRQQLEIVAREQEEFARQSRILQETQIRIMQELSKKIEETEKKIADIDQFLESPDARKDDRPASNVLKETLRRLGAPK